MMIRLKTIIAMLLISLALLLMVFASGCRAHKTIVNHDTIASDSFALAIVPVDKIEGQLPAVGDSLSIPGMHISVHRISETQALVKKPVQREVVRETETVLLPTNKVRNVDKSRTYTDSYNKDKSQNAPRKVKQVEKTDNSVKVMPDRKTSSFPWWWWLLIFLFVLIGFLARRGLAKNFLKRFV